MPTVKIKKINIPDYGEFYIRRASALLQMKVSTLLNSDNASEQRDLETRMLILEGVLVDENGKRIYEGERRAELQEFDTQLVTAILSEAASFNKVSSDEPVKNFEPIPTASSPSELLGGTVDGTPISL